MSELRFEDVTVRYGTGRRAMKAVDGVSLTVPTGQVVGLVGESGSGKSTLARAAVGLAPVAAGRVLLDGRDVRHRPARGSGRAVQMVFQDPYASLDPRMSAGDSVAEAIPRTGSAARRAEVTRLFGMVGLDAAHISSRPSELSGGQCQRVALARALAARPQIVVADEITSALDVSVQGTVLNLVRDLQQQTRLGMLFISHNLAVVRYVSDIIAVMYLGRIVECGPAQKVLTDPQHPYTRELLAAAPHRDGYAANSAREESGAVLDTEPPDPHHLPAGCCFHPRCPVGPLALPARTDCLSLDPAVGAVGRRHATACHFAAPLPTPSHQAT
ncbi:ABC transporter ATP-binding protein [Streptomyces sp. HGB0020]|uniref:ABC transporter ATP-binding protein n=1 Tax=Streptomyces sp. HGB0020 TaxID=1078086 RepID=UPI00034E6357|nr:ABC transporter ATP-binding protein [Streptomyces sp. HGB0020]EPD69568.1 oligopeptide/dipeptide ABC transporter, ATP-binding protein domain [Streptomyces sp. HGB0020]